MNLLDVALVFLLGVGAVGGYRLGFIARALGWVGIGVGLFAAVFTVPFALQLIPENDALTKLLVGVLALVVTVGVIGGIGEATGLRLRRVVNRGPLGSLDRGLGAVAGLVGVLVFVWFLAPAASQVPGTVARQFRSSAIVGFVDDVAPRAPDPLRALRSVIDTSRFPDVFADLRPAPDTGPPPEQFAVSEEVIARVTASTVNVESRACGGIYEGSGFAVAEDLIATNAHVVAGSQDLQVRRPDGSTADATVVAFDDDRDLALLSVPGLGQAPLPLGDAQVGTDAAVVGYPGGQDTPNRQPARITERRPTTGRDIYHRDVTQRQVLYLAAALRQGDSGAPLFDQQGRVVGVIFAVAADRSTTAYALDRSELEAVLAGPRDQAVGPCTN